MEGMGRILWIYEGVECALGDICGEGKESEGKSCGVGKEGESYRGVMEGLRKISSIPHLARAGRLRRDLSHLTYRDSSSHDRAGPRLKALTQHITSSTSHAPHLLLAYTWVLYMALFSGGRYIRTKLREAGREFWNSCAEAEKKKEKEKDGDINIDIDKGALSFWNFDGEADGEDIKAEFKQRFADIEGWLNDEERKGVVQEAVFIMESLMGVVEEIAEIVGRDESFRKAAGRHGGVDGEELSVRWLCLKHILPMGMFELIKGAGKVVKMGFEPLYGKADGVM